MSRTPLSAAAVAHAQPSSTGDSAEVVWLDTETCKGLGDSDLSSFDAFWIAPGSPYKSMEGALRVIRYARLNDAPLLGTCGGFQHVVLEYARNVLGFSDAQHAEYDPYSSRLFIKELECSLAGQSMPVNIAPGSVAAGAYGATAATERYYCDFGLNMDYLDDLQAGGMVVSGDGCGRRAPDHRTAGAPVLCRHVVRAADQGAPKNVLTHWWLHSWMPRRLSVPPSRASGRTDSLVSASGNGSL